MNSSSSLGKTVFVNGEEPGRNPWQRTVLHPQHHYCGPTLQILQHPQDLVFPHKRCNATPGRSAGHLPLGLLQLPLGWTCESTVAAYPERYRTPCLQSSQILPCDTPRNLHWLPVAAHIQFKRMVLAFKAVNGTAPIYLQTLVRPHAPVRALRSSTSASWMVPPLLRAKKSPLSKWGCN